MIINAATDVLIVDLGVVGTLVDLVLLGRVPLASLHAAQRTACLCTRKLRVERKSVRERRC
jgi:hypothetical protein